MCERHPPPVLAFLQRRFPAAGSLALDPLRGDGSARRFWRLQHASDRWVLAYNAVDSESARRENRWQLEVHRFLSARGIDVPHLEAADPEAGLFLMEDLGDTHLYDLAAGRPRSDRALEAILPHYEQAIDHLVRMQAAGDGPPTGDPAAVPPPYDPSFILRHESGYFYKELVRGFCARACSWESLRGDCERLAQEAFVGLHEPVLMHRDYQSRNLMVVPGGQRPAAPARAPASPPDAGDGQARVVVIDYQGARPGPPEYDLAALLYDPYADLPPAMRTHLLRSYRDARGQADDETWRVRLRANAANRLMQALGAFAKLGFRMGRPGFREHIPAGLRLLAEVLGSRPGCPALLDLVRSLSCEPCPGTRAAPVGQRHEPPRLSVVILCGGQSRRFGAEKALARFRGAALIEQQLRALDAITDDLLISTNQPDRFAHLQRRMLPDRMPGLGPLGGIEAALCAARHDLLAVVACDMPFVSVVVLNFLAAQAGSYDMVVPLRERPPYGLRPEPLHAIYARSALGLITGAIDQGHLKPALLVEEANSRLVPPEEWLPILGSAPPWYANVNTIADLESLAGDDGEG